MSKRMGMSVGMALLLGGLLSAPVSAQGTAACGATPCSATVNATASISIPIVLYLNVTNTAIDFGTATATDFSNGFVAAPLASVVSAGGNVQHTVSLAADAANFSATNTVTGIAARTDKPSTDLRVSTDAFAGMDLGVTTAGTTLISGAAPGYAASLAEISYRMNVAWADDTPGDYDLSLTYTVAAD